MSLLSSTLICAFFSLQALAFRLPTRVEHGPIIDKVSLSGTIEPLHSEIVKVRWFSLVKRIAVELGQPVKKGDLIAEVEVKYLEFRKQYLISREKFLEKNITHARIDEKYVESQKKRMQSLVAKEIMARSELEKFEIKSVEALLRRTTAEKELRDLQKQLQDVDRQIRESNYFSPITGVITHLILNPKQLSGAFLAMPQAQLARVDRPGEYIVKALAVDTQVSPLRIGQTATVTLEGSGEKYLALLQGITNSQVMSKQGLALFEVTVVFKKEGPILGRGLLAKVDLVASEKSAIQIPWNALYITPTRTTVLVAQGSEWLEREVTLGTRSQSRVEILSGLKPQDVVVAELW